MTSRDRLVQLKCAVPAVVALAAIYFAVRISGIRVNASSSLPIGLYKTTSDPTAELVEFCPTELFASLSALPGYRAKGICQDGAEPLMKSVVAVKGDIAKVPNRGVAVNGMLLPNSIAQPVDTKNRLLTHWPFGKYQVIPGIVWVISSHDSRSFDSRYFGPIPIKSIRFRLRPFFTE